MVEAEFGGEAGVNGVSPGVQFISLTGRQICTCLSP